MKVSLARHGGQIAAINLGRPPRVVDTARLPQGEAEHLSALIAAAKAEATAPKGPHRIRPDEMSYTITIEDDDGRTTLRQSDTTMTNGFQALSDWIERHAG